MPDAFSPVPQSSIDGEARLRRWSAGVLWGLAVAFAGCAALGSARGWPGAVANAQAAGKFSVEAYAEWGEYWASLVNAVLCGVLGILFWFTTWGKEKGRENKRVSVEALAAISRREWVFLGLMIGAAAGLRWGRMDLSLYNDEAHTFRRYIAGHFRSSGADDDAAKPKWRQVRWVETLWLDQVGNNSAPCSILGRLGYDAWRKLWGAQAGAMCEPAIRLQALFAGLGSLAVLWLLVRRLLPGAACWWVLILGSVHPWHLRYSTEARGYGLLLLGVCACFYCLLRALEDNGWKWWLGLGASEFLCVWSFPGAVYWLAVFEMVLTAGLIWRMRKTRCGPGPLQRSLTGAGIGGMAALQLMLPTAPQLLAAMNSLESLKGPMGLSWWKDVAGGLICGMRWVDNDAANPWNVTVSRLMAQSPWLATTALGVVTGASLLGMVLLARKGLAAVLLGLSGPAAVVLSWALMRTQGHFLHPWYMLYALPGIIGALAFAACHKEWPRWLKGVAIGLISVCLAAFWWRGDAVYLVRSKENLKNVLRLIREDERQAAGRRGDYLLAGVFSDVDVYTPQVRIINNVQELNKMIDTARASSRRLYVTYGRKPLMQANKPDILRRLEEKALFRPLGQVFGLEEGQFTHYVYALRRP